MNARLSSSRRPRIRVVVFLFLFWTLLGLIFGAASYSVAETSSSAGVRALPIFASNLLKFYLWAAIAPLIFYLTRKFPFDRADRLPVSAAVHLTACAFLAGSHSNLFGIIDYLAGSPFYLQQPRVEDLFRGSLFFGHFFLGILLYIMILVISQAYLLFSDAQSEKLRAARIREQLAEADLQALKMQLRPHFLFNALHSIASLNATDPPAAGRMIAKLGDFLRRTLETSNEQFVTLAEEMDFLRYYLEIEQVRFGDRLSVSFDVQDGVRDAEVPHLILQPLVENAVKHGTTSLGGTGEIVVSASAADGELRMSVQNTIPAEPPRDKPASTGTGMANVRRRLEEIYGPRQSFELVTDAGRANATVKIPYRTETDNLTNDG